MPATEDESKATGETRIGQEQLRRELPDIVDRAWDGERFIVGRHERDRIVILGVRDYEKLRALEAAAA